MQPPRKPWSWAGHVQAPTCGGVPQDRVSRAAPNKYSPASARWWHAVEHARGSPHAPRRPAGSARRPKGATRASLTNADHAGIAGATAIADRCDVVVCEELTVSFRGTPDAAAPVLCTGITADDHARLQAHGADLARSAAYLHGRRIGGALTNPSDFVCRAVVARRLRVRVEPFPLRADRPSARAQP